MRHLCHFCQCLRVGGDAENPHPGDLQCVYARVRDGKNSTWIREALRVNLELIALYQSSNTAVPVVIIRLIRPVCYQQFNLLPANKCRISNELKQR